MTTGKKPASDASRILRDPKSTKKQREVAASDLATPGRGFVEKEEIGEGTVMTDYRIDCVNKPDRKSRHEKYHACGRAKP
jgi:hypothetical protein